MYSPSPELSTTANCNNVTASAFAEAVFSVNNPFPQAHPNSKRKGCDGLKRFLIFTAFLCLLAGFLFRTKATTGFVTHADITWQTEHHRHHRHYRSPDKIQKLLLYLRTLRPKGNAHIDPEVLNGNTCKIVLYYENGEHQIYYQQADRYLSVDAHPWERISQIQAEKLYGLLEEMPSDLP